MSIQNVREYLAPLGLADRVLEFETSSATVELAARAAGVIPARIAKSLSLMLPEGPILLVAAGDARIDNPHFKAQFHAKAKMLSADEVTLRIGHAVGGVCPFAIKSDVRTWLDVSLKRFDTVYPACGSANSAIELSCDELEAAAQGFAGWVDVCKGWQEETLS
jgi:prolyl-tRNA editing enzyme YbaK/EbsC (Cys-tRNA(Pro) deacylase)